MTRRFNDDEVRQRPRIHNDVEKSPVEDWRAARYYERSRGVLEHPVRPLTTTLKGQRDG